MPPVLHVLCNVTILSEIHYSRFVLFVKNRKRAAPPDGGAARRISAQPEQRLHPQPELDVEVEVPPTLQHEPQPQRRQHPQSQRRQHPQPVDVDVPATVPLGCVQVQVQVQVGFVVEVPPTEPVVCLQQGLQHRCWTKSGNTRPPKQPLQEEAILYPSIKDPGTSVPASFYAASARTVPKNSKTRTAHGRPGFGYKNRKKTQRLENCGARRAAFKPYFFLSFILGSRVRKPAAFSVARNSGLTLSRARATP